MKLRGLFSTARFRDFRRRVKDWIPDLPARAWACAIIPTILCLSFLISLGPTVQETLVGLLSSDAPTVYGSAYEDNLVDFPTLGEWLLQGVHWLYLAMAVPPVIFAARSTRFSYFICRLTAAIFVILCVTDFLFETLDRSLTVSSALINCASNLAGSVLLIFTLSAIFWIYEAMRGLAPTGYSDMAGAVSLFLIGASLSSACYFILSYFYRPVEVAFELVAKAPVHGGYVSRPEKLQKEEGAYRRPLSIIPEEAKGGQGHATIPGEVAVIGWKSGEPHKVFDVKIDFFSDCPYSKDIRSLPSGPASIVRKNVKSFALTTDKGLNVIEIAEHPQNGFSYTAKTPHFFWLTRPDEKNRKWKSSFLEDLMRSSSIGDRTGSFST